MHEIAFVPIILFLIFVAPVWVILHYVTKWRAARGLSADDERLLADLWHNATRMEDRIRQLERILDAEAPGWRTKQ
jgi:phage shock protein B